jgi:hypothetical protein
MIIQIVLWFIYLATLAGMLDFEWISLTLRAQVLSWVLTELDQNG